MIQSSRRVLGVTIPRLKHFGPLLVVWGAAMLMLVFIRDLGSSLMYFGAFLALVYVATNRFSFVVAGLVLFAGGAWFFANTVGHVQNRIDTWLNPFAPGLYDARRRLLPDRQRALRAGRRRALRPRAGRVAAEPAGRRRR